jgi:arsenate reductase (thioredoxin)
VDEKDAPTSPPPEPAPSAPAPAAPAAGPASQAAPDQPVIGAGTDDPMVMAPNVESDQAVVTKVRKKRFKRFDSLWESVKRTFSGEEHSGGVIPAGAVNRARHRQPRVFFVDTGNAAASQFAEAFALQEGLHAESGGTFPAGDISQEAFTAMDEKGIDLRGCRPKLIDPSRLHSFDRVVLLGGMFPPAWREGVRIEEWEVLNPAGLPLEGYRLVRDDVEKRVKRLAKILHGKQAAQDAKAKAMLKAR